ncbi:hypothetical protein LTR50_005467 [Elasticomyces elasticus]|nr:hypothetical protein LTR50_005467 [Elasticomyces elasticus]
MAVDVLSTPAPALPSIPSSKLGSIPSVKNAANNIIDIRQEKVSISLIEEIQRGLRPAEGKEKRLPTLLLYDEAGLKLFEEITYLDEYYLTNAEIEVLEGNAKQIAERIATRPASMVIELGSGNLRKVKILLDALEKVERAVQYYALDLSPEELQRTLSAIPEGTYKHVKCFGLLGTYDDGLTWLKLQSENAAKPKSILSLGSSIGNFDRNEAAKFINQFTDVLNPTDTFLFGVDACTDPGKVYHAYNDRHGLTHRFVLNGLVHANRLLGREAFVLRDWKVVGEYDEDAGRHQAFVSSVKDVVIDGVNIAAGERIRIEESYKYSAEQSSKLWIDAGVLEGAKWTTSSGDYALHLLNRPKAVYPSRVEEFAAAPVPSLADWADLWTVWDTVTREMIPEEELLAKPIKLRNACIFYLGHIPTFLDMQLTRATNGKPTEPSHYPRIFERGIDPDVDNPEQCHAHSEIPDTWPPVQEILYFQTRVRLRVKELYRSGLATTDRKLGRVMWLGYEHEIMHLETLLYMLVQSEKTLPPPGTITPDFEALASQARRAAVPNEWVNIPAQTVKIGLNDPENDDGPDRYFGWDNEKPERSVQVHSFSARARPITIAEYVEYLEETGIQRLPALWLQKVVRQTNGNGHSTNGHATNGHSNGSPSKNDDFLHDKAVRTVYGAVPLALALDWPVSASYDELLGCAKWMGGRIPTMEEVRSIYSYAEQLKKKEADKALGRTIPAVNGHLVNDGVEETPPSRPELDGASGTTTSLDPHDLFVDLQGANVGFKHWHPMPVTQNGGKLSGQGDMGGVWEWTSSALEKHEGFEPMPLYPAYTGASSPYPLSIFLILV